MHMKNNTIFIVFMSGICFAQSQTENEPEEKIHQIKEGNLIFPESQQPSPLFSFGQNIVDKNDLLLFFDNIYLKRINEKYNTITPFLVYGIQDYLSVLFAVPFAARFQVNGIQSTGVADAFVQFEWQYYNKEAVTYTNQATLVASAIFPTGTAPSPDSEIQVPATGLGATSFLLGGTAEHTGIRWYAFGSLFGLVSTHQRNKSKQGNIFFYQAGVGHNIGNPGGTLLNWMVEFNGYYTKKDIIKGTLDPNSGGHTFFIGPSLYFATERSTIQVGVSVPVFQRFNGNQNKNIYDFELLISWKFNSGQKDED